MAWTAPRTWVAGELVTASIMNTHVRDNFEALYPAACRVYHSANQAVASGGGGGTLAFNSEDYDTDAMHSTSVNTSRITATRAGKYHVGAVLIWAANATGQRQVFINRNGSTIAANVHNNAGGSVGAQMALSCDVALTAGQYVEVGVWQNSGGSLNVEAFGIQSPSLWAHRISA